MTRTPLGTRLSCLACGAALLLSLFAYLFPRSIPLSTQPEASAAFTRAAQILSHYSVHRCVHTLTGLPNPSGVHAIRLSNSHTYLSFPDHSHVMINGMVYRIGWLDDYQGLKLLDELSWALGVNETYLSV